MFTAYFVDSASPHVDERSATALLGQQSEYV
jgi:hypothetical protein